MGRQPGVPVVALNGVNSVGRIRPSLRGDLPMNTLFAPRPSFASLILRLGLAAIFLVHGWIKLDVGMDQSAELIAGVSRSTQTAVGAAEFVCGLAMLVGLASRLAAVVLGVIQFGAIMLVS